MVPFLQQMAISWSSNSPLISSCICARVGNSLASSSWTQEKMLSASEDLIDDIRATTGCCWMFLAVFLCDSILEKAIALSKGVYPEVGWGVYPRPLIDSLGYSNRKMVTVYELFFLLLCCSIQAYIIIR